MTLLPHLTPERPWIVIEGELLDERRHPLSQCTVQVVEWEGDVLDATVEWGSRFRLRVPRPEYPLVVFFRITTLDDAAVSTHDERDSPSLVIHPSDQQLRVRLVALRSAYESSSHTWQPAWRVERLIG